MTSATPSRPGATASLAGSFPRGLVAGSLTYTRSGLVRLFACLLAGDVVFTLVDQIEPKILPVILKNHGASDQAIAVIVSSITAVMQLLVMPVVSYRSDRLRTRWGRRIPFIFWGTPLVSLFLALTPFAPEIARWLLGVDGVGAWLSGRSVPAVVLVFGLLALMYRFVQAAVSTMFMCLFRDVVPMSHMGRFLALFRVFGALGTFVMTYWLLGLAETQAKPIFIGLAVLNLVAFLGLCWFVREGNYPPVVETTDAATGGSFSLWRAIRRFVLESFSHRIYWWTYLTRTLIYSAIPISSFIIFFPQQELGLTLDQTGKLMSWSAFLWIVIAYPFGRLIDRYGAASVLNLGLALSTVGYLLSFFFVVGPKTFLASCLLTGIGYWVVMLSQTALTQEIFNPARFAQLGSANVLLWSLVIAVAVSPLVGWSLDAMRGFHSTLALPGIGTVDLQRYRFVNLMLAVVYGGAWLSLRQVQRYRRRYLDATGAYQPPG